MKLIRENPTPALPAAVRALAVAAMLGSATIAAWAAGGTGAAVKPDAVKGEALASQVCVACHTVDGSRGLSANPILKGQHPEYLVKQLHEFKSGKRDNAVMKGFAGALSDEDMLHLAAFYAGKAMPAGAARDKDTVLLGERIYRGGIPDRLVPACAGCHSPNGAGIPAQYPRLGGQHAEYTEAQMIAFRAGTRKNSAQMMGVAAKMNDREIKAVSDYIAGLR